MNSNSDSVEIRTVGECTIREVTELWSSGFRHYFKDSSRTALQTVEYFGRNGIHPDLSVVAFQAGEPAGFVYVGMKSVQGRKLAWNGGTAVSPAFRGKGLSSLLLLEAIRRLRKEGADQFSLETRTDNASAIKSYERCGFKIVDKLLVLRRNGAFERVPFRLGRLTEYRSAVDAPEAVRALPFYRHATSWTTQWFHAEGSQALLVWDGAGQLCGYAIYRKIRNQSGQVTGVQITHCEADPMREDARDIVRYMLREVFGPADADLERTARYMPSRSIQAIEEMQREGFEPVLEEFLMVLELADS